MGKPVLLGVDGEAKSILNKYNAGQYFKPEDSISFKKSLYLLKDRKVYRELKSGCIDLAKEYSRKKLAE